MVVLEAVGHIVYYITLGDEVDERRLPMSAHVPPSKQNFDLPHLLHPIRYPKS